MNNIKDILEGIFDQSDAKLVSSVRSSVIIKYLKDAQIDMLYKKILLPSSQTVINRKPQISDILTGFYGVFAYEDPFHDVYWFLFYRESERIGYETCISCKRSESSSPIYGFTDQYKIYSNVSNINLEILNAPKNPLVIWTKEQGDSIINMLKSCHDIEWSES